MTAIIIWESSYPKNDTRPEDGQILEGKWTVRGASKEYRVPYNMLKDRFFI
jgi:hypothetical protein